MLRISTVAHRRTLLLTWQFFLGLGPFLNVPDFDYLPLNTEDESVLNAVNPTRLLPPPVRCSYQTCTTYASDSAPIRRQGILNSLPLKPPGRLWTAVGSAVLERKQCNQKLSLISEGQLQVRVAENGSLLVEGAARVNYEGRNDAGSRPLEIHQVPAPSVIRHPLPLAGQVANYHTELERPPITTGEREELELSSYDAHAVGWCTHIAFPCSDINALVLVGHAGTGVSVPNFTLNVERLLASSIKDEYSSKLEISRLQPAVGDGQRLGHSSLASCELMAVDVPDKVTELDLETIAQEFATSYDSMKIELRSRSPSICCMSYLDRVYSVSRREPGAVPSFDGLYTSTGIAGSQRTSIVPAKEVDSEALSVFRADMAASLQSLTLGAGRLAGSSGPGSEYVSGSNPPPMEEDKHSNRALVYTDVASNNAAQKTDSRALEPRRNNTLPWPKPQSPAPDGDRLYWTLESSAECLLKSCAWYAPAKQPVQLQGIIGDQTLIPPGTLYLSDKTVVLERTACGQKLTLAGQGLLQVQFLPTGTLRFLGAGSVLFEGIDKAGPCAFRSLATPGAPSIQYPPVQAGTTAANFMIARDRNNAVIVLTKNGHVLLDWMDGKSPGQRLESQQGVRVDLSVVASRQLTPIPETLTMNDLGGISRNIQDQFRGASLPSEQNQQELLVDLDQELGMISRYGGELDPGPLYSSWYKVLRYVSPELSGQAALHIFAKAPGVPLAPEALYQAWARLTLEPELSEAKHMLKDRLEAALANKYAGSVWAQSVYRGAHPPKLPVHR